MIFPDADVLGIGGITSSPFETGLAASGHDDPALAVAGAPAHNRWLADVFESFPQLKLAAIAARTGPTPEEIHDQPVPASPDRAT